MFQLKTNYDCMFTSTDLLFNLLSEYDIFFSLKEDNFIVTDTLIYKYLSLTAEWVYLFRILI